MAVSDEDAQQRSVESIQLGEVATVGKQLAWPQFIISIQENNRETHGGQFRITNADRAQAVRWLRSAADAIEAERQLQLGSFQ